MLIINTRCKRCGGSLYIERNIEGDTLKCLACGFERDIPAEVNPVPVVNITQEVIKVAAKIPETVVKTPGQILYEKHAAEKGLKTAWEDFAQFQKDRYEREAAGTWTRKQSAKKPKPDNKERIVPGYKCPYCGLGFSQSEALIQHMMVCQKLPFRGHDAKPVLPPWSEIKNESEAVKISWMEAVSR